VPAAAGSPFGSRNRGCVADCQLVIIRHGPVPCRAYPHGRALGEKPDDLTGIIHIWHL